jgi:hypothetical protein
MRRDNSATLEYPFSLGAPCQRSNIPWITRRDLKCYFGYLFSPVVTEPDHIKHLQIALHNKMQLGHFTRAWSCLVLVSMQL